MTETPGRPAELPDPPNRPDFPDEPTPGREAADEPTLSDTLDALDDARVLLDSSADALVEFRRYVAAERLDDYRAAQDNVSRSWATLVLALTTLREIGPVT